MNKSSFEKHINNLYSDALLHIAYMSDDPGDHIIYALIECYPRELEASGVLPTQTLKFNDRTFHYIRIKMSALEAVKIYRGCIDEALLILTTSKESIIIETPSMMDYKSWPHFLCAEKNNSEGIPFIPNTWGACRIHQMFPSEQNKDLLNLFTHGSSVSDWLKSFLTWDISEFPELIGGVCFLLPNPYYRTRNIHLIPGGYNNPDKVKIEFQLRRDVYLSSLTIYPVEKTHFGYSIGSSGLPTSFGLPDMHSRLGLQECITIPLIGKSEYFSYVIMDEYNEVIDRAAPAGFWKGFSISISVGASKKKVTRTRSGKTDVSDVYENVASIEERVENGILQERFDRAAARRKKKAEIAKSGLKVFHDDHAGAEEFLREKIREARMKVIIVDPYISSEEVYAYAMATGNINAQVKVLTSKDKLNKEFALPGANIEFNGMPYIIKEVDAIKEGIKQYKKQNAGDIEVYIMKNKPYPIHDRFLVVDDNVWFCGSSLHSIGGRMSCIIRLPNGDEVMQYIDDLLYSDEVEELVIPKEAGTVVSEEDNDE